MVKKKKRRKVNWSRIIVLGVSVVLICSLLLGGCIKAISFIAHHNDGFTKDDFMTTQNGILQINKKGYEGVAGIDISSFQGEINWYNVKDSGIDFAMIRCGFRDGNTGQLYEDPLAYKNVENATEYGVEVGLYFYSSAITKEELQEEIDFVLGFAKQYKITYPIAYDMEPMEDGNGRIKDLSIDDKTKMAMTFCKEMEKEGYVPMIYGNQDWLVNNVDFDEVKKYDIWYAGYVEEPTLDYKFSMWQYSNAGDIAGVAGNVDMNLLIRKK